MKRTIAIVLFLTVMLTLIACDVGYASSYRAIALVQSNGRTSYRISFYELTGTATATIRRTEAGEGELYYSASLEAGEVNVYYDANGVKELLFTVKGGETVEGRGGYVEEGRRIYIIVETVGEAKNGSIRIGTKPVKED